MGKANGLSPNESENELCLSNNDVVDENDLRKVELLSDEDGREYGYVTGLTAEDIMKKVFRSEEHAYEFFGRLGKCNGFGVRKGDYAKDEDGSVVRRRFFCNRAGLRDGKHYNRLDRKRCHRPETRTNCQALMSVYLDKGSSVWKVVSPHFDVHADQGKWLEEGDDCRIEQDGGANDRWDHVIGTAQSQTRNMRGVANTVDWNIEVIDLWLGNLPFDCSSCSDFSIYRTCFVADIVFGNFFIFYFMALFVL
ncbi:hypothetical protein AHAS_Ahas03G0319200 [Arachis hypogaea]